MIIGCQMSIMGAAPSPFLYILCCNLLYYIVVLLFCSILLYYNVLYSVVSAARARFFCFTLHIMLLRQIIGEKKMCYTGREQGQVRCRWAEGSLFRSPKELSRLLFFPAVRWTITNNQILE